MKMMRYIRLLVGIVLYALAIGLMIKADLGLAPWEAFHIGLSQTLGVSFGMVSIFVGTAIITITYHMYESIGIGTIASNFMVGFFVDILFALNWIPAPKSMLQAIVMIFSGMIILATATYCYVGSAFGTGPRDGLMVALTKTYDKPIGLIRGMIELSVLLIGYMLGAKIGLGTLLIGFGIGPIVQTVFKLLNFDVKSIRHTALLQKNSG
jgi:uncharacterized membrane protein YczE